MLQYKTTLLAIMPPAKHECCVSQGSVETLFRWGRKRLQNYITLWQIWSGKYAPNFVRIGRVL